MAEERDRVLVGECISRAAIDAARGASLDQVEAAIAACDYERAATFAFARAKDGAPPPTEVIARILPGIELPAITFALLAIAPDRAQLIDMLERRRFPQVKDAAELEAIVLYAAWRAGADLARVIPVLRRLSARTMTVEGYALLATIAQSITDEHVAAATKPIAAFAKEYAKQVATDDKSLTMSIDAVLATLPAEVETPTAAGFTVRGAKQVGRNDPCPCGSGLKYKRCCADKPQVAPSPIAGLSWDQFLASDRITPEHIAELPLRELVRIDVTRLGDQPLFALLHRFEMAHEWQHCERVVAEGGRRDDVVANNLRNEIVHFLLDADEMARARTHIAQLPAEDASAYALDLAIDDGPEAAWRQLVRSAREVVASSDKIPSIDFAYSLLRGEPALGIIAARACIGTMYVDDPEMLLDTVEEARDRMNIAPVDPAWEVLDELIEKGETGEHAPDTEAQLRTSLQESAARADRLEGKLAAMRLELEATRTRPAAELVRAPEDRDRTASLDAKVRELEALIREGNEERRELRKQLDHAAHVEASARREGPRARRPTVVETDDDIGDDVDAGNRGIAIPRFERRATDALANVPSTVAAEAMRTVGTLCAGDSVAWRGVKQARDMTRPVFMARVGIHHRLLFRVEGGGLDVLDLITREQLTTTLKRLRAAR